MSETLIDRIPEVYQEYAEDEQSLEDVVATGEYYSLLKLVASLSKTRATVRARRTPNDGDIAWALYSLCFLPLMPKPNGDSDDEESDGESTIREARTVLLEQVSDGGVELIPPSELGAENSITILDFMLPSEGIESEMMTIGAILERGGKELLNDHIEDVQE